MNERLNNYFTKWWQPLLGYVIILILGLFTDNIDSKVVNVIFSVLLIATLISILISTIVQFAYKTWLAGLISIVSFIAVTVIISGIYLFTGLYISEDKFARDLTIPENIDLSEPTPWGNSEKVDSSYKDFLIHTLLNTDKELDKLEIDLTSFLECYKFHPDKFSRYLATSPSWRVFEERGNKYATKRWNIKNNWKYTLHGYYTNHGMDLDYNKYPNFQNRLTLGLSNKTWIKNENRATSIKIPIGILTTDARKNESNEFLILECNNILIETFEQSPFNSKVLTQSSLSYLNNEFYNVNKRGIKGAIPDSTIKNGLPIFKLHDSFQGGIYSSEIWINPGESGMIYLKAFEVTKNTKLSEYRLKEKTTEWIGWSDNPDELFYSNTLFTIYEGSWGNPYAARFEIWFVPDSGSEERKLMEKIFKIEGWER